MPTYSTCVFCGKNDSPPHKEDVLPKWIARRFPDAVWIISDSDTKFSYKTRGHLGLTTRKPCRRCNNEWMSQLEDVGEPALAPLIEGKTTALVPLHQHIIITWFVKTAVMYDAHAGKKREPYFTDAECRALMTSYAFDPHTQLFLAAYKGEWPVKVQEDHVKLSMLDNVQERILPDVLRAYALTLIIKYLVLQAFFVRGLPENSAVRVPNFRGAYVRLDGTDIVTWPPRLWLNDETIESFCFRWSRLAPP